MSEQNPNYNYQEQYAQQPVQPEQQPQQPVQQSQKKPTVIASVLIIVVGALAILASALLILNNIGAIAPKPVASEDDDYDPERDSFINSLGGTSETFEGVLSLYGYGSSEEAAEAFVNEELSGGYAYINKVESKGELSQSEIDALNLPGYIEYDAVEKVEVTYEIDNPYAFGGGASGIAKSESKQKTAVVYVIKCGPDWKYFAPLPETGDTINKSYYDSVFNSDRYKNCTLEQTVEVYMNIQAEGESIEMTISTEQFIQYQDGKIYMEQRVTSSGYGEEVNETIYLYIEEDEYGYVTCYAKTSEYDWREVYLSQVGFYDIDELTPFYDQYLDYTYFTKASYGFKLADENARRYFEDALMSELGSLGSYIDQDNMKLDMYAEYYVQEGALTGMRTNADVNITIDAYGESGTLEESVISEVKVYDYGTTVIERPFFD